MRGKGQCPKSVILVFLSSSASALMSLLDTIHTYLRSYSTDTQDKLEKLAQLYIHWNKHVNLISRKDIDQLAQNHILYSLSISKLISFSDGTKVLDLGTGGGFPGFPLAIIFPKVAFTLLDSNQKKIKIVKEIGQKLELSNVQTLAMRAEAHEETYDFVIGRAITHLPQFFSWSKEKIKKESKNLLPNGILYLKGGDFQKELAQIPWNITTYPVHAYFPLPYFVTKKIVHLYPKK